MVEKPRWLIVKFGKVCVVGIDLVRLRRSQGNRRNTEQSHYECNDTHNNLLVDNELNCFTDLRMSPNFR